MSATEKSKGALRGLLKVNLLIHRGEEVKFYLRLTRWILSAGRFIVIFVEVVVIGAFVLRYKLDSDITASRDQIKELVPYVKSLKNDEVNIRRTQLQLATIKQIRANNPNYVQLFSKIAQLTPKSIKLNNISLDRSQSFPNINMVISGQTPSNLELSAFLKALKKDPNFSEINLSNISFENQTVFTITGKIAGGRSLKN